MLETHSHTRNQPYRIIYGRSLFIQYTMCTVRIQIRVRSLCEPMFQILQVSFHLEYDVYNWKANYFIVSIFGSLTFSFIFYTTLLRFWFLCRSVVRSAGLKFML